MPEMPDIAAYLAALRPRLLEQRIAVDLAHDVADHAAEARSQELDLFRVALELLGVGVALRLDQSLAPDAHIALP